MSSCHTSPSYQDVDGFRIAGYFSAEAFRSALAYKPRPDDLFIVTYPKCGTTWVQNIIACIFCHGEPFHDGMELLIRATFLEFSGATAALTMKRPGAIKVHLPFHMIPYNPEAKYIFVARNPKDCCVSFYHHTKSLVGYNFQEGTFDDFFELFIRGEVDFGDYFDTLLSWYHHRNDHNVMFLTYEQLKEDTRKYILDIAGFLGGNYREELERDVDLLDKVLKYSSFEHMKKSLNERLEKMEEVPEVLVANNPDLPEGLRHSLSASLFEGKGSPSVTFVRKGVVGDWKSLMSEEQSRRLDEKFEERTRGTDIPKFWEKYM